MSNGADIHHKDNDGHTALTFGIYYLDKFFKINFILLNNSS